MQQTVVFLILSLKDSKNGAILAILEIPMQTGMQMNAENLQKCALAEFGNLAMHFHKIYFILLYLVVGRTRAGAGPHNLKKGTFLYVPEPKSTDFQQKYPCLALG